MEPNSGTTESSRSHFIRAIVEEDLKAGTYGGRVVTRFPPEPNGYLHIGHAKSICLNFGLAADFGGVCHLRFDDTNPETEDPEYVASIQNDVRWLGFDWQGRLFYASDYYGRLYAFAQELIRQGKAYVCSLNEEQMRAMRGTVTEPGQPSPDRDRPIAESLALLDQMRTGAFAEGTYTLRAKIDMAATNMKMRDPALYRIKHTPHYRTGDAWHIYPMYDFAHCLSDAIEGITHSICTLEFDNNRELYDWILAQLTPPPRPQQTEFARLNLTYTVLSKRKLIQLVEGKHVSGWDDPRMPTIAGLRRRGCTASAIRLFCDRIGVAKANSLVEIELLEHCLREDLDPTVPRTMAVLRPLKVVLTNLPAEHEEHLEAPDFPDQPEKGSRTIAFTRELYIERDDFMESPPPKYHRLAPGREVRLRLAGVIRCDEVIKDANGEVVELRCTYDPSTRHGGRKVKGIVHWISAAHARPATVRLYNRLFTVERPDAGPEDFLTYVDRGSVETLAALVEPGVPSADVPRYQFERQGYFFRDPDSRPDAPVFNRIVGLKDAWAKAAEEPAEKVTEKAPEKPVDATSQAQAREKATAEARARLLADPAAAARWSRATALGLGPAEADALAADAALTAFFEAGLSVGAAPRALAGWVLNDLQGALKGRPLGGIPLDGAALGKLVKLVDAGTITSRVAKDLLGELVQSGGDPEALVAARGLSQVQDEGAIQAVVDRVIAANPDKVAAFRAGRTGLAGFFVGQIMKETRGTASPALVQKLVEAALQGK